MNKPLKAFEVRDNDEGHCTIQFATNSATARREGASELNVDWESVESCRRKPEFDSYAPGPVPPLVLIAHGWHFECSECYRQVSDDMGEDLEAEDLNPNDFVPRGHGKHGVFCSEACEEKHTEDLRLNKDAKAELLRIFNEKFPGATVQHVHVFGNKLEPSEPGFCGHRCSVSFTFPGATHGGSTFVYGDDDMCLVATGDVKAFNEWRDN
ncbi:MAG: hypothetical protein M0Q44_01100 [Methylobacter sp.]|nr:hypothetical protein [Methylobacter sp.]